MSDHLPPFEDLGHRQYLANGSCLSLFQDVPAQFFDAIITDPPYSSGGLHKGSRGKDPREKYRGSDAEILEPSFEGDQRDQRSWILWCSLWLEECYRVTRRGGYCALRIAERATPNPSNPTGSRSEVEALRLASPLCLPDL